MPDVENSKEYNSAVDMFLKMYFLLDTGSRLSPNCNVT